MAARSDWHFARLSNAELDVILRFDPDVNPNKPAEEELLRLRTYVNTVQSIVDDSLETW